MAEISTNIILNGITLALEEAFPDSHIETNPVNQAPMPPAFIVNLVTATVETYSAQRQKRNLQFDVLYYPEEKNEECYNVADALCKILELITLSGGDKLRGTDMSFKVVDGVLHFLVSYRYFAYQSMDEVNMETLSLEQGGN